MIRMPEGGTSHHVLDRAFEREFPPKEQRKVAELLNAFHRDERSVFGRILLKFLTPESKNSVIDFGSGWKAVIDIKKGLVTSLSPLDEARNADGKVWRWDDISELVLDPDLIPETIAKWKQAKKEAKIKKKQEKVGEIVVPEEEAEQTLPDPIEKNIEDISFEIEEFLKYYQIKGQKLWVSTDEILENFKEYKKEEVLEALKLQYEYQGKIKKYPAFAKTEDAGWRYDVEE
jgi:hypothetical protein